MTKQQENQMLHLFLKAFSMIEDGLVEKVSEQVKEDLEPRFQNIEGKIDWIIGALDTDEKERLALGFNFDRKHADHERRIGTLELAATNVVNP